MAIKTRKPSCAIPYPLILVEGAEKSGKSWACAEFSASPKIGTTYWIDLGEGTADEYGAIPGARYEIVEHNGTFGQILAAIYSVRAEAQAIADAKEPPVCLVVDSMTAEWDLLKGLAEATARRRTAKRIKREVGPDEEVKIDMDLWNEANARHRKIMDALMTFPGIVIMTARGKEVVAMDDNGRPLSNQRDYKVEGQKNLAYDASAWIRFSRDHAPMVIGARSVIAGVRPGVDKIRPNPSLTIEKLVFDILKCDPYATHTRDLVTPNADLDATESPDMLELAFDIQAATSIDELKAIWPKIGAAVEAEKINIREGEILQASIRVKGTQLEEITT